MQTDLVLNPFGASVAELVEVAVAAEEAGFDGVWTLDHFSAAVFGGRWSRDPFVVLSAIAARTQRIALGVLVANMVNRHPVHLALAVNSLQSLAPGRVRCGIGAGASPGSRFAAEQDAIHRRLGDGPARRAQLTETIGALRALWRGDDSFDGAGVRFDGLTAVLDGAAPPPIIVGASGAQTIALAAAHADGVNIQRSPLLADHVAITRESPRAGFHVSVYENFDATHPDGADMDGLIDVGVGHRTLFVSVPYPLAMIQTVGARLTALRT